LIDESTGFYFKNSDPKKQNCTLKIQGLSSIWSHALERGPKRFIIITINVIILFQKKTKQNKTKQNNFR